MMRRLFGLLIFLAVILCCAVAFAGNDTMATATVISSGTSYSENIKNGDDVDFYKFTTTSAGYVTISFSHIYDNSDYRWTVELKSPDDGTYLSRSFMGKIQTEETTCPVGLPAGTYYIRVAPFKSYSYCTANYQVRVNFSATDEWEKEFNNDAGSATTMAINTKYGGSIVDGEDKDIFKFSLSSAGYVSLAFSHDYVDAGDKWKLQLTDVNSNSFLERCFAGRKTTEESTCKIGLPAGVYYVRVLPNKTYDSTDARYFVRVDFTASNQWESEFNNGASTSDPISLNTDYSGCIVDGGDVDFYQFSTDHDGTVQIAFSNDYLDAGNKWIVNLMNENSDVYMSWYFMARSTTKTTTFKMGLPAGTYLISVTPNKTYDWFDGTYTFSVVYDQTSDWETEWNDTIVTADPYVLATWRKGLIHNGNDRDHSKLVIPATGQYKLILSHKYCDNNGDRWKASVVDESSNEIASWKYKGNDTTEVTSYVNLQPGTYYLRIEAAYTYAPAIEEYTWAFCEASVDPGTKKTDISEASIEVSDQIYTGKAITPPLAVILKGKVLAEGTDYTVQWNNNKDVGEAIVTIIGAGNYEGTKSATFKILPKKVKLSTLKAGKKKLTVKWKKGKGIDGYEIQYSLKANFKGKKTVTISNAKKKSAVISKLKKRKTYYVRIRAFKIVGGVKYYSEWSEVKSKKTK